MKNKFLAVMSILLIVILVSGCISQAPDVIDDQPDDGTGDQSELDSQMSDVENLNSDIDDSDLETLDQDLSEIDW